MRSTPFRRDLPISNHFNPRTPLQSAIVSVMRIHRLFLHFNPRTPLQSAILHIRVPPTQPTLFQSTHSITECDRKIWCFGPQNPHLAIKKYIKRRTNVLKKDISALFIGANPLGKTCALRVRTKSQIINGSSRARVCFAPYTSILP